MNNTSRFGRSKFGGSQTTLLIISAIIGCAIAAACGIAFAIFNHTELRFVVKFLIAFGCMWPTAAILAWALLVDRNTIRGAIKNPEKSIESHWFDQAASATLVDTMALTGIALTLISITEWQITGTNTLAGCLIFMMIDLGLRYLISSKRG